jgi:hypothetical protein
MPEKTPAELLKEATEAVEKAEAAAKRAEKSAVGPKFTMGAGLLLALVGAVLAFALKDTHASVLGISLRPFGGVLFAAGVLLVAGVAIASMGTVGGDGNSSSDSGGVKAIGGLIAVVVGIIAVTALAVVTLTRLDSESKDSVVAVTTSAFGIISAVVGAYLGIKISADTNQKASDEAKHAAVAKNQANTAMQEANVAQQEANAATAKITEVAPDKVGVVKAAMDQAGQEAARAPDPPQGGVVA